MTHESLTNPPCLLCYGNLTIDDVVLPDGTEMLGCIGGDALYATLAARAFDPTAQPVAPLGCNVDPSLISAMSNVGLSMAGMCKRDSPTLHNRVVYDNFGGRKWTVYNDAMDFSILSPVIGDIPPSWLTAARHLILAMDLDATTALVKNLCPNPQQIVAFDPQEDYIYEHEEQLLEIIKAVDIFMPSEEEVFRLLGHRNWPQAARYFSSIGPSLVIVKRGESGVLLYDRDQDLEFHIPVHPRAKNAPQDILDVTGAGDTFCGAFMAALNTNSPEIAALAGCTAASFTVMGYGSSELFETPSTKIYQHFKDWLQVGAWHGSGTSADPVIWQD